MWLIISIISKEPVGARTPLYCVTDPLGRGQPRGTSNKEHSEMRTVCGNGPLRRGQPLCYTDSRVTIIRGGGVHASTIIIITIPVLDSASPDTWTNIGSRLAGHHPVRATHQLPGGSGYNRYTSSPWLLMSCSPVGKRAR